MDARQLPVASTYNQSDLFRINRRELHEQDSVILQHQSPISEGTVCCVSRYPGFQTAPETINSISRREPPSYNEHVFPNQQHHQQHLLFNSTQQPASEVGLTFFRNGTESAENQTFSSYEFLPSVEDIVLSKGTDISVHLDYHQFPKYESETNNGILAVTDQLTSPKEALSTMPSGTTMFLNEHPRFETDYRYNPFTGAGNVGGESLDTSNPNARIVENSSMTQFPLKTQMHLQTKSPFGLKTLSFEKNPKQFPFFDPDLTCCSPPQPPPEIDEQVSKHLQGHHQNDTDCLHANNINNSITGCPIAANKPNLDKVVDIENSKSICNPNEQNNTKTEAESGEADSDPTVDTTTQSHGEEGQENSNQTKDSSVDCVKPALSYIALIATAILESSQQRLSLGSIYSWIETNYPYYRNRSQGWRNSVRHNLSLNDCFVKAGRCEDGKGNYWAIHPANVQDFMRGDFRQRRRSRRRGRKSNPCDLNIYPSGYLHSPSGLGMTPQALSTFTPALNPIYSPYTEAERQAYRLDEALLRQTMNSPFVKWYHSPVPSASFSSNANDFKGSGAQWQTYPEKSIHQLGTFSR